MHRDRMEAQSRPRLGAMSKRSRRTKVLASPRGLPGTTVGSRGVGTVKRRATRPAAHSKDLRKTLKINRPPESAGLDVGRLRSLAWVGLGRSRPLARRRMIYSSSAIIAPNKPCVSPIGPAVKYKVLVGADCEPLPKSSAHRPSISSGPHGPITCPSIVLLVL
jgi:hypothetical protein